MAYFHISEGDQFEEDLEGIDLLNIAAAQDEAIRAARRKEAGGGTRG